MQSGAIQLLANQFDALGQQTPDERIEFWFARDLMEPLGKHSECNQSRH